MDLNGKVVWITGASSGIGRELARQLSVRGAKLILTARREAALEETRAACANSDVHKILAIDLSKYHDAALWADAAIKKFGHVDMLINNAGVSQRGHVYTTGIEVDEALMTINYFSPVALSKALMPHFMERKSGYYVAISSVAGKLGAPRRTTYSATKHAIIGFFDSFRNEMFPYGVGVSVVCPGYVKTPIASSALNEKNEAANEVDPDIESGMSVTEAVRRMIRGIEKETPEILVATGMPWLAYHLRRLIPNTFHRLMPKLAPAQKAK